MYSEFKNMKMRVANEGEARSLLTHLFEQGYTWSGGNTDYKNTDKNFFFTKENGRITVCDTLEYWERQPHETVEIKTSVRVIGLQAIRRQVCGVSMTKEEALDYIEQLFK